jgi:hypothetical protein
VECDDSPFVDEWKTAQAVEFIRALRHELHAMTSRLAWIERQGVGGSKARARAIRLEAAALRRDIKKAQVLIDRLQRRYLSGDAGPPARSRRPSRVVRSSTG